MPPPELPEGFEIEEGSDLPEGFAIDDTAASDPLPRGYVETGNRVEVLPETTFEVDVNRPQRSRTIVGEGPSTEYREIAKAVRMRAPSGREGMVLRDQQQEARSRGFEDLDPREAAVGTHVGEDTRGGLERLSAWASGRDPQAFGEGFNVSPSISVLGPVRDLAAGRIEAAPAAAGAADTLLSGFGDEMAGARDAAYGAAAQHGVDFSGAALLAGMDPGAVVAADQGASPGEMYERGRDIYRGAEAGLREDSPESYAAGQATGSVPYAFIPGGASTRLGRIGMAGATGAGLGALHGAGSSEEEDLSGVVGDALARGGVEGAAGLVMGGAAEAAGPALSRLGRWAQGAGRSMQQGAAEARLEAHGLVPNPAPSSRYGRALARLGGPEEVARMLETERVGGFFPTAADTPEAVARLDREAGRQFDDVLSRMDRASAGVPVQRYVEGIEGAARGMEGIRTGPAQRAAQRMRQEYIEPQVDAGAPRPQPLAQRDMSWQQAHDLRQQLDQESRAWSRSADPAETSAGGMAQEARDQLGSLMNEAAAGVSPGTRDTWQQANRRYALSRLLDENARQGGSRLPSAIAEGIGVGTGDPVQATTARATGWLLSRYGPAFRARGLGGMSRALRSLGGRGPQWASVLDAASRRGQRAVAAAHWLLSQRDPEYRQATQQLQNEAEE